jgi:protein-tyrosine kinase
MSRIQDILNKAERDGTARRTRPLVDEYAAPPAPEAREARGFVESAPRPATEPVFPPRVRAVEPAIAAPAAVEPMPPQPRVRFSEPTRSATELADTAVMEDPEADVSQRAIAELDPLLVAALAPMSLAAEQYRSLRTRLKRVESGRTLRTIVITSPSIGDGKSLTAANLSLTMAQEFQHRVLLIDADLRRPTVHRLFGLADGPGLSDVLMSGAELDQALVSLPDHHLTVLPAGMPPTHPAELLGSATMRRVLDTLRQRFDRILIDMPPVAPLADLHIVVPMVDGLLMIVRAGITPKPAIERALSGLDQSKVLGLVLNEVGGEGADGEYYQGYGYIAG